MVEKSRVSNMQKMVIDEIKKIEPFDDMERECISETI